jgi:Putative adhesin
MNSTHRLVFVVAAAALLAAAPARASWLASDPPDGQQQQTEKFSKTVPLPKGGALDLSNISGDIVITGGAGDQVVIDAVKRGKATEDLKLVQIEVTAGASRVEVRTQYPRERKNVNVSVDFTVTVPRAAGVTVRTVSGDLNLATIDGELMADSVSGDVTVKSAGRLESARTVSGNVVVASAGSEGDISFASVSGDVKVSQIKARGIEANSVSGGVTLAEVTCSRAGVKSVSGDIDFAGPLAKGGRYRLQSHSGGVTVRVSDNAGFEVNAGTFSGDITSDLPIVSTFGGEGERGQAGRRPKSGGPGQRVQGTFGDGGAWLELTTFSGDVRIVSKTAAKAVKK